MHPTLKAFDDYWHQLRGGRDIPLFLDFNINDVPPGTIPYMSLIKVEADPLRFRYRLAGTSIVAAYQEDLTGRYLDELDMGDKKQSYLTVFTRVALERKVDGRREGYTLEDGTRYRFEGNLYPFEGVDGRVSRIVIVAVDSYERNG
jgi:hypothetical protein